jgi:6-phosphogluconolactonase
MQIKEYSDRDMVAIYLSNVLAGALKKCLLHHPFASFAVPGGTSPGPIFDVLSATDLEWDRVHVMLTDERWVPEDHERSNARLVRERLLQGQAAAASFLPFFRSGMSAQEAAAGLSADLKDELPISLLLLGMGTDMHTASLFLGADGLEAAMAPRAPAVCAIAADSQPETRITLSAQVLNGAMEKHLVIYGNEKREAFEKAMRLDPLEAPISAVMDGGTVHWAA